MLAYTISGPHLRYIILEPLGDFLRTTETSLEAMETSLEALETSLEVAAVAALTPDYPEHCDDLEIE